MLEYKGYIGNYSFSKEDNCYHGKIINISDLIIFESNDELSIEQAFKDAVNDYINIKN